MTNQFQLIDGIKCYAPELAYQNTDFPKTIFQFLYESEENNFWFISRNNVIKYLFSHYIKIPQASVLEIGCGTGFVLKHLKENFPDYNIMGSEIHLEGIKFAQERLPNIEFLQLNALKIPFKEEFDIIGAFDVLEHIEDDETVIQQIYQALKSNAYFILSVPQYQWMWSQSDDIVCHKRRYEKKELKAKLQKAGFEVKYISSFVFMLFPLMYFSRLVKRITFRKEDIQETELKELQLNKYLNSIFVQIMKIDEFLIKQNISLPFGGSLIAVAQKI